MESTKLPKRICKIFRTFFFKVAVFFLCWIVCGEAGAAAKRSKQKNYISLQSPCQALEKNIFCRSGLSAARCPG